MQAHARLSTRHLVVGHWSLQAFHTACYHNVQPDRSGLEGDFVRDCIIQKRQITNIIDSVGLKYDATTFLIFNVVKHMNKTWMPATCSRIQPRIYTF